MAQVNNESGVSQVPPTVVVPLSTSSSGASDTQGKSVAKTVTYMQTEPGVTVTTKRS